MRSRGVWCILVLISVLCIPGAGAIGIDGNGTVFPQRSNVNSDPGHRTIGNIILPGMTYPLSLRHSQFYQETIPYGMSRYWVDVAWTPVSGPYTLSIYSPDAVLGPYANTANGIRDGRIFLEIAADGNLTPGTWYYQVSGNGSSPPYGYSFQTWQNTGPKAS